MSGEWPSATARPAPPAIVVGTILRHDARVTSYKLALLRAINDVVLAYPHLDQAGCAVAIPLRVLARYWVAYYWPFADPQRPILQGQRSRQAGRVRNDLSFRPQLTRLRQLWEGLIGGPARPADGYFLIGELLVPRRRATYPSELHQAYAEALGAIVRALHQPIRYAGPGEWTVFSRPTSLLQLPDAVAAPQARPEDDCLVVPADLWAAFRDLSLWVEALAIHEWCLFTEGLRTTASDEGEDLRPADRGDVYRLLTDRPGNRRPLTWERNHVDVLLLEGKTFVCPWTERTLRRPDEYDLDHLVPVSLYPINELWNLVPADRRFNTHVKRDRLPSRERLTRARPHLLSTYASYLTMPSLARALGEDTAVRFGVMGPADDLAAPLSTAVVRYLDQVAESRSVARFS